MSNQQNDDFIDDDNDILDVTEEGIEEISDYDDSDEGIFVPPAPKKKNFSSILLGTVAVVALLGVAGYYFSGSNDAELMPAADQTVLAQNAPDPDLSAIPQPHPIANPPEAAVAAPLADPMVAPAEPVPEPVADYVALEDIPVPPPEASEPVATQPDPVPADIAMPVPPAVEETKEAAVPVDAPAEPMKQDDAVEIVDAAPPQQAELSTVPDTKPEEAVKVAPKPGTVSGEQKETVYYDAPMGKALTDIPAPSMDPKRGRHESIIVVSDTITASNQDSEVMSANRALRLGRYETALEMYNSLYRANPRDERILMGRAVTLQKLGRSAEAIKAYEAVLDLDSGNPDAVINMMGLVRKEYPAVALEKLLNLRTRYPGNVSILAQLGVAYADAGNLEEASKSLLQVIRMEPNNPQHYFNMGVISERMKNRTRAIAYYEKALEIDAVYGTGRGINRDMIYDRLARLR